MIVITVTNCPPKLRGDLTKWLCEIDVGVYVGQVNARVREELWIRVCENIQNGRASMVYNYANEQHLEFRTHNTEWRIRDFDGIKLMMHPKAPELTADEVDVLPEGFSKASKRLIADKAKKSKANKNREWVFLDIETTGLDSENDDIIEIAAIKANNTEIKSKWSVFIKQDKPIPKNITELTGITDEMLSDGIKMSDALSELRKIIERNMVVCYNKRFDIVFLEREYKKYGIESPFSKITDALVLARKRIMDIDNYKLSCLADYFKISYKEQHRAISDCDLLYRVFLKLNEI